MMRNAPFQLDLSRGRLRTACLLVGAVMAAYGGYRMYLTSVLTLRGYLVEAQVAYMDHRLSGPDEPVDPWHREARFSRRAYRTVVFNTDDGRRVVDQPWVSWANYASKGLLSPKRVPRQRTALVLYDPHEPRRWLFDDATALWVIPSVFLVPGCGLLLCMALVKPTARRLST